MIAKEDWKKYIWAVALIITGIAINAVLSSYTTTAQSITQGKEAYNKVVRVEMQVDSMQKTCVKERQSNALFQQEMRQEVRFVKDGQQEMKSDLKDIKLILMQKK
jgi:hypothetical protein